MRTILASLVILICAIPAYAQDATPSFDWTAYSVMVAGNVADLVTTKQAFDRGAVEKNPVLSGRGFGEIVAVKAVSVFVASLMVHRLQAQGHPRAARIAAWFDGGVGFTVAIHNARVAR